VNRGKDLVGDGRTGGESAVPDCGWLHEKLSTLHTCVCLYEKKNDEWAWSLLPSSPRWKLSAHGLSAQMSSGDSVTHPSAGGMKLMKCFRMELEHDHDGNLYSLFLFKLNLTFWRLKISQV